MEGCSIISGVHVIPAQAEDGPAVVRGGDGGGGRRNAYARRVFEHQELQDNRTVTQSVTGLPAHVPQPAAPAAVGP
jgi:hypothetical protein